jgi:lipoate---protein ligase
MTLLDLSLDTPQENLALEETLLLHAESGKTGETLRFWESEKYFVSIGAGGKYENEIRSGACARGGIPVIRRISAGGSVLLGPGCLNYSLVLSLTDRNLGDIKRSYEYILGKIIARLKLKGLESRFEPSSDIAFNNRKVSGNSQARKKNFLLHHGTLLYGFDLALIPLYLKEPSARPPYRGPRTHAEFTANLPLAARELKEIVTEAFGASGAEKEGLMKDLLADAAVLAGIKYNLESWNRERKI